MQWLSKLHLVSEPVQGSVFSDKAKKKSSAKESCHTPKYVWVNGRWHPPWFEEHCLVQGTVSSIMT